MTDQSCAVNGCARVTAGLYYQSMRITIRVVPRSSKNQLLGPLPDGSFKVRLTAPPVDGKANEALIKLLSEYFDMPKSKIEIVRGAKGRNKVVEIT